MFIHYVLFGCMFVFLLISYLWNLTYRGVEGFLLNVTFHCSTVQCSTVHCSTFLFQTQWCLLPTLLLAKLACLEKNVMFTFRFWVSITSKPHGSLPPTNLQGPDGQQTAGGSKDQQNAGVRKLRKANVWCWCLNYGVYQMVWVQVQVSLHLRFFFLFGWSSTSKSLFQGCTRRPDAFFSIIWWSHLKCTFTHSSDQPQRSSKLSFLQLVFSDARHFVIWPWQLVGASWRWELAVEHLHWLERCCWVVRAPRPQV